MRSGEPERRFHGSGRRMLGSFFTLSPTEAEATPAFNYLRVTFLFAICVIAYQLTMSFWLFVTLWAWFLVPIRHAERVRVRESSQSKKRQHKPR